MHMGNHFQFTAVQLGHISVGIGDEVVGWGFVTHIGIPAGGERVIAIVSAHSHAELRTLGQFVGANGDGLAGGKIDIVLRVAGELAVCALCAVLGIVGDGHLAADGEDTAAHTHAAAEG